MAITVCIAMFPTGLCLNAYECRIQNGESHGPCALGFGVCCVCKYNYIHSLILVFVIPVRPKHLSSFFFVYECYNLSPDLFNVRHIQEHYYSDKICSLYYILTKRNFDFVQCTLKPYRPHHLHRRFTVTDITVFDLGESLFIISEMARASVAKTRELTNLP